MTHALIGMSANAAFAIFGLRCLNRAQRLVPALVLADTGGRRWRGALGPYEVHRRSVRGQSPHAPRPPRPAPGHRGVLVTAMAAGTISGPATRWPLSRPSRESYRQYPLQPRPAAVMFAPCLLGCPGTTRQHLASSATVTCAIADYPAGNGMESTDLIAEQRTLNPRVRGSSPWRRTRRSSRFSGAHFHVCL